MEKAEMTEAQRAEIEEIAASVDVKADEKDKAEDKPKPIPKPEKKDKKDKKESKAPSKDDVMSAVAGVVLAEMKFWPEEVVALIGDQHPNKDSFLKGVAYVIGAYMHFASEALRFRRDKRKREAEVKTAKLLGPVATELQELQAQYKASIEQAVRDLEAERKKRLQKVTETVNRMFNRKIAEARSVEVPESITKLIGRDALIKEAFDGACSTIDKETEALMQQIKAIDEQKDDWGSKGRKARRLGKKEQKAAVQQPQTTAE